MLLSIFLAMLQKRSSEKLWNVKTLFWYFFFVETDLAILTTYRILILPDIWLNRRWRKILKENIYIFIFYKTCPYFCPLFHPYFLHIQKVLKKVCLLQVRIFCTTDFCSSGRISGKWNRISGRIPEIKKGQPEVRYNLLCQTVSIKRYIFFWII